MILRSSMTLISVAMMMTLSAPTARAQAYAQVRAQKIKTRSVAAAPYPMGQGARSRIPSAPVPPAAKALTPPAKTKSARAEDVLKELDSVDWGSKEIAGLDEGN